MWSDIQNSRLLKTNLSPAVLLIHPLGQVWFETGGKVLEEPPSAQRPVVIVVDLIEETHVQIEVPAIGGKDRQNFVQIQLESLLPETPFKAVWQAPSGWPVLAKAFSLNAAGISSPTLKDAVDAQLALERPIVGVWSLSHLMTRWAATQKNINDQAWVLLAFVQAHGLRMVLLKEGVPIFSRLLFDNGTNVQELVHTIKYLGDNRVLERDVQPPIVVLQAPDGFESDLQAQGLKLLPNTSTAHTAHALVWPELVKLAQRHAPGQMASVFERRFYLAQQARLGLLFGGAVLIFGLLWGVYGQAQAVWMRLQQTQDGQHQSVEMHSQAQSIQQAITASGVDTGVMRLAIEVQRQELENGIELLTPFWSLGRLLSSQAQTRLNKVSLGLRTQACGPVSPTHTPPPSDPSAGTALQTEWIFEISPQENTSPRERQRLLEEAAQMVQSWEDWRIKVNPVQEAAIAPISVEQAGVAASPSAWQWCLSQMPKTASTPEKTTLQGVAR